MFGSILLTVITVMQVYVFWRADMVPFLKRRVSRRLLIGTGLVLWTVFLLGRFIGHGSTGTLAVTLEFLGMNWMAVVFLLTVPLLVVDMITMFGFVLHRLSAPLGVWAVLGNHEYHGRDNSDASQMNYDGIRVLNNAWAAVRPSFILAGVDDLTANHRSGQGGDPISKALAGRPPGATVFLSHMPWHADRIARDGVGLMLSGHTHGGQIWPFGYLVQRIYPLIGGRYEVDGMTVIVCRGTGTWGPRMRLWRPGEILRVTLHAEERQVHSAAEQ